MKPPDEAWVRRMAELEDGLPVSAGGLPFRQVEPPSSVDPEIQWLRAMAELEDGLPVSAGGWPFRILAPATPRPTNPAAADSPTPPGEDHSLDNA
jgi:hypothetical protein